MDAETIEVVILIVFVAVVSFYLFFESRRDRGSTQPVRELPEVRASPTAVELVRDRGNRLFVWEEPLSDRSAYAILRTATERPPSREFVRVRGFDAFELFVDRDLSLSHLDLRRERWPRDGIAAGPK